MSGPDLSGERISLVLDAPQIYSKEWNAGGSADDAFSIMRSGKVFQLSKLLTAKGNPLCRLTDRG